MYSSILLTATVLVAPPPPTGGCGNCWAAGYCAVYAPASTQVPANCPLGLAPKPDPAPPLPPVRSTVPPESAPSLATSNRLRQVMSRNNLA